MLAWHYKVTLNSPDGAGAHFELRTDDETRPFHLKVDPENNYIAVNFMENGAWGAEIPVPNNAKIDTREDIDVFMFGRRIYIQIQGHVSLYYMKLSSDNYTLHAAGKNVSFEWGQRKLVLPARVSYLNSSNHPISDVNILGRVLSLGSVQNKTMAYDLAHDSEHNNSRYLGFLSSRLLYCAGESFTIIDADQKSIHLALVASILYPSARIMKVCADEETNLFLREILTENGIENISCCAVDEAVREIREGEGAILLQGSLVFDLMGDFLDKLPKARKGKLSVYSQTDTVLSTNKLSPYGNVDLQLNGGWAIQFNRIAEHSDHNRQLDVIVASYNASSYISQCVGSILNHARDDIRVIVVDDGSTDDTRSLLEREFGFDDRLTVLFKENGGCASARNYGRLRSLASHIAFVDADDFVSRDFFPTLFDVANYSGCEVVQGGFDFFDAAQLEPHRPSYEEEYYRTRPREKFGNLDVLKVSFRDMAVGQPSIWRRVYRRDFLDSRGIFFRESVRAYDDYSFQLLSTHEARDAIFVPGLKYHYRQHLGQDVRSGDIRHFNMITMFHEVFASAIINSWSDVDVFLESMSHSLQWSISALDPHLKDPFMASCAKLCARIIKCFGNASRTIILSQISHPNFDKYLEEELARLHAYPPGAFWHMIASDLSHPDVLRMRAATRRAL